jgi:hypothetical protein
VTPYDLFDISLGEQCKVVSQISSNHWEAPLLTFPCRYGTVELVGTLYGLSSRGMIVQAKDEKIDLFKTWPHFLVMQCLRKHTEIPIGKQLILATSRSGYSKEPFFEEADQLLIHYLEYYLSSLQMPSPLIPEWIPSLLTQDPADCLSFLHDNFTKPFSRLYNPYLNWIVKETSLLFDEKFIEQWKPQAGLLFSDLHTHWCTPKNKRNTIDENI